MASKKAAKSSKKGAIIALLVVILVIGGMAAYSYFNNKVYFSSSTKQGNTAGNLYNGGLFCESDGRIYFSNPNDEYTLYSMNTDLTDFKKHYNDYVRYINADENYVYYSRMNNKKENGSQSIFVFYSTGVYRLNKRNNSLAVITSEPSGSLMLFKNRLYYQVYLNNSLTLHSVGIDNEHDVRLVTDDTPMVSAMNDTIYYAGRNKDHFIHSINSSGNDSVAFEIDAHMPIATEKGVYYIDTTDNYKLRFVAFGSNESELVIDKNISWYNMSDDGRFIFYETDSEKEAGIYVFDIISSDITRILAGNFKWLNVAGGYCFFYDFSKELAYAYEYRTGRLNSFNPPKLKK